MKFLKYILLFIGFQTLVAQQELKHQVYFETDKYNIPETEHSRLLLFLSKLNSDTIEKVAIYGFCDDRGTDNYNLVLSQQRANAIKNVFTNQKFKDSLITNVDGKGEILLNVVHLEDLSKIRGLNRKVEIIVSQKLPPKIEMPKPLTVEAKLKGDLKAGDKITLKNLLFITNYSHLTKESQFRLNKIAKVLVKRKEIYFTIEGHVCCTRGTRDAMDKRTKKRNLSVARSKYVYDYLAKKGVSKARMKYVGHKRKFPLGGDPKYDRRVELLVTKVVKD